MDNKNIYDTGLYLRLSKDDADVDGGKKTESNSISGFMIFTLMMAIRGRILKDRNFRE